jgi:hypothetical protein
LVSSATPILKSNGVAYQNTEGDWSHLIVASLAARYLDLVPFDDLVDRRNAEPTIFATDLEADPDGELGRSPTSPPRARRSSPPSALVSPNQSRGLPVVLLLQDMVFVRTAPQ